MVGNHPISFWFESHRMIYLSSTSKSWFERWFHNHPMGRLVIFPWDQLRNITWDEYEWSHVTNMNHPMGWSDILTILCDEHLVIKNNFWFFLKKYFYLKKTLYPRGKKFKFFEIQELCGCVWPCVCVRVLNATYQALPTWPVCFLSFSFFFLLLLLCFRLRFVFVVVVARSIVQRRSLEQTCGIVQRPDT